MRFILKLFLLVLFLLPVGLLAALWFALSEQPALEVAQPLSHRDIERAKALIQQNDPRRLPAGAERSIAIAQDDLGLALTYLLQRHSRGGARFAIEPHRMQLLATFELPLVPSRSFVNLRAELEQDTVLPQLTALQVGDVSLPGPVARWLWRNLSTRLGEEQEFVQFATAIRRIEFTPGKLAVAYQWRPDTLRALGSRMAGANPQSMAAYHARLLSLQQQGVGLHGSIMDSLPILFELAQQRSAQSDPVEENRALLLVLGAWASERGVRNLLPDIHREPRSFALTLRGRRDLAQHFLVSAAIAAGGDTALSNAIGVFKEMSDSRGGSGFSFVDLTADRAGTRLGALAVSSHRDATYLHDFMIKKPSEPDLMPDVHGLQENMSEAAFKARYAGVDSPAYRRVLEEIEQRLAACRLYQPE